jgi:hypothetical protein
MDNCRECAKHTRLTKWLDKNRVVCRGFQNLSNAALRILEMIPGFIFYLKIVAVMRYIVTVQRDGERVK